MGLVYNALGNLNNIDFFNILLPFVLFLAITYGLLQKAGIFGKDGQKINAVISIAISFFAVNYTTYGANIGAYLTRLFGSGSLALATILLFLIALQFFDIKLEKLGIPKSFTDDNIIKWGIVLAVLGIGFFSFYNTGYAGYGRFSLPVIGGLYLSNDIITTLIVLTIIGGAVWLILKTDGGKGGGGAAPAGGDSHAKKDEHHG